MENMTQKKRKIPNSLKQDIINELKCKICNGIIRDCYGMSECFHLFCYNCINEYLNNNKDNKIIRCPFCKKEWGAYKTCNSMKIKINNMDNIIDIIFPELEKENKRAKKEFIKNLYKAKEELDNENNKKDNYSIQILLKPFPNVENIKEKLPLIKNNFIEVKMNTTFTEIKKNICRKLGMSVINYEEIVLRKQGLIIDDSFIDIQSYYDFDQNFRESNERILFFSRKID